VRGNLGGGGVFSVCTWNPFQYFVTNLFILFIYTAKHASERLYFIYFFWLRWRLFCNTLTLRDEKEWERGRKRQQHRQRRQRVRVSRRWFAYGVRSTLLLFICLFYYSSFFDNFFFYCLAFCIFSACFAERLSAVWTCHGRCSTANEWCEQPVVCLERKIGGLSLGLKERAIYSNIMSLGGWLS